MSSVREKDAECHPACKQVGTHIDCYSHAETNFFPLHNSGITGFTLLVARGFPALFLFLTKSTPQALGLKNNIHTSVGRFSLFFMAKAVC